MSAPKVPILFLVFNRPKDTLEVFEAIRAYQPEQLFIAGDGPRPGHSTDEQQVAETRKVADKVDWPCEVKTLFRNENLGCKAAVQGAISWFFENVEEGMIIEDDCLPHPTFFRFCQELLEKYRSDERIVMIGGFGGIHPEIADSMSYYFSRATSVWGWASWRRAWALYDEEMNELEEFLEAGILEKHLHYKDRVNGRKKAWLRTKNNQEDSWGHRWAFSIMKNHKMVIRPAVSMIKNIGFAEDGTHTFNVDHPWANTPLQATKFPLKHPEKVEVDPEIHEWLIKWDGEFRSKESPGPQQHPIKSVLKKIPVVSPILRIIWSAIKPQKTTA